MLHVSTSHDGRLFATCSKDGQLCVWRTDPPVALLHAHDMRLYNWKHTHHSEFNATDTLLLVSGVYKGGHQTTAGEIAVFSVAAATDAADAADAGAGATTTSQLRCRIVNRPFDTFGTWLTAGHLLSGDLRWLAHLVSSTVVRVTHVDERTDADAVPEQRTLVRFCNRNASSVRQLLVADVARTWPETAAAGAAESAVVEDAGNAEDSAESVVRDAKLLIFLCGSSTYSPHEIGFKFLGAGAGDSASAAGGGPPADRQRFDAADRRLDLRGHIVGMALSPDHRRLYVNCRRWPSGARIANVLEPPPIAREARTRAFDVRTLREVVAVGGGGEAPQLAEFTATEEAFVLVPAVCEDYVAR